MLEQGKTRRPPTLATVVGVVLFAFALGFRLVGIGWGLKNDLHNASYHPDEPVIFGYSRAIVPGQGQFVPHFYNYGTLYLTALRIASDVTTTYTGAPKGQGDGWSWRNPAKTDWDWVSRCTLAGRVLSCLAGAGTVLVVYALMLRRMGIVAGVFAAAAIALAPAHLIHSRFQTVDVAATFFLAVSLFYAVKLASEEAGSVLSWKDVLLASLFAGLSAGTKYTGILAVLSIICALAVRRPKGWLVASFASAITAGAILALTTPGIFLDSEKFWTDFQFEMGHTATGHGLLFVGTPSGFVYHLLNLFVGIGPLVILFGLVGLGWAAFRKHRWAWVLLAFFIPYYVLIGRAEVKFIRYTLPLYVGIASGFGYAMSVCHFRGRWARVGVGLGIFGLAGFPSGGLTASIALTRGMVAEDPRDTAARALKQEKGPVGFVQNNWYWSPPLFPDSAEPLSVSEETRVAQMSASQPPIAFVTTPDGQPTEWSLDLINKLQPDLIAFSSFQAYPLLRLKGMTGLDPAFQPAVDAGSQFLDLLPKRYKVQETFGIENSNQTNPDLLPEDFLYTMPVVWIWKKTK